MIFFLTESEIIDKQTELTEDIPFIENIDSLEENQEIFVYSFDEGVLEGSTVVKTDTEENISNETVVFE